MLKLNDYIPTSRVLKLLNKSSWSVNIKSMQVGFVDWKHVGDEMGLDRLKRFSKSSEYLLPVVQLKSPIIFIFCWKCIYSLW